MNGKAWVPQWKGRDTKPLLNLDPPLPTAGKHLVWIAKAAGRGTLRVNETPGPANDHVLSMTIEDNLPGAHWYEIVVAW